ncbi:MAG: DUF493 family protein [Cyclobacteriaceae bacterium]
MSWDSKSFREKLEAEHTFPGPYVFKFIVPLAKESEVTDLLPKGSLSARHSANKKYVSITLKTRLSSADEVVGVYEKAYLVEGIISL